MHSNTPYPGSVFQRWHSEPHAHSLHRRDPHLALLATHRTRTPWGAGDGGGEGGPPGGRSVGLGLKFPLCDTSVENGSFEVLPGSHLLHDYQQQGSETRGSGRDFDDIYNDHLLAGDLSQLEAAAAGSGDVAFGPPIRLNLKRGDAYLADPRTIHRGTENRSLAARPESAQSFKIQPFQNAQRTLTGCGRCLAVVICYASPDKHLAFAGCFQEGGITPEEYAALRLSPRGERLLGHNQARL